MLERFDTAIRYSEWPAEDNRCPHSQTVKARAALPRVMSETEAIRVQALLYIQTLEDWLPDEEAIISGSVEHFGHLPNSDKIVQTGLNFMRQCLDKIHIPNETAPYLDEREVEANDVFVANAEIGLRFITFLFKNVIEAFDGPITPEIAERAATVVRTISRKYMRLHKDTATMAEGVLVSTEIETSTPRFEITSEGIDISTEIATRLAAEFKNPQINRHLRPLYCPAFEFDVHDKLIRILEKVAITSTPSARA